jgi:3-hydroxyacyl-[acyl-carrier-protein] dehydratase
MTGLSGANGNGSSAPRSVPAGAGGPVGGIADPVALLPHRPPFRFVDRVDELVPGERVRASYTVTGDEAFLAGHFPGNPIFPGVIQLEALAQAGAVALLADERYAGRLPLFGGVEDARFRRQVVPGDEVTLEVTMDKLSSRGGWGTAVASIAGKPCCQARLFFVLAPSPT